MFIKNKNILLNCYSWNDIRNKINQLTNTKDIGNLFELINKYYLLINPEYSSIIKNVWLINEVPDYVRKYLNLPIQDEGIDIIVQTKRDTYWSIQSKYLSDTSKSINRKYVSTFTDLSFNICKNIEFALVCTTASKSSRKFDSLYSNIGFLFNNIWEELDDEFFQRLHNYLKNTDISLKPFEPKTHQISVLQDTVKYFKNEGNTRGKIIMPTGTGKSLTGFWIFQKLNVDKILICVPSLALVKQMIEVWARETEANKIDVNWIAICSDESVEPDSSVSNTQELGIFIETDIEKIAKQLSNNISKKLIVFTTYQSSKVTSQASKLANITYDLGIYDEAHKTVGRKDKLFSYLLFDKNIKVNNRIFMTATERRFQGSNDDILSMDDVNTYGEDIHVMSFKDAIEFNPPILSDYTIVTINVNSSEIQELIEANQFVFPQKKGWDIEVQSEMLASMIALRKAMQKYPIKHTVSFHGSIEKATKFEEFQHILTNSFNKEFGELDVFHVKGSYSTAKRKVILRDFANSKKSLVTNARCLTEGVDVPSIDGILFADPKKSTVDIVQAIGRALRLSKGKEKGYVIIPVIIDNEEIKETSYESILYLLRALASQDERIIDYYRYKNSSNKTNPNIEIDIDIPETINIDGDKFISSLDTKIWNKLAKLSWMPFEEARELIRSLKLQSKTEWENFVKGNLINDINFPKDIPTNPNSTYRNKGWINWGDFLGTGNIANFDRNYISYNEAKKFVHKLKLKNIDEWRSYCKGERPDLESLPDNIPKTPNQSYKNKGWLGVGDWLGTGNTLTKYENKKSYDEAKKFVHKLGLKSGLEWRKYCKDEYTNLEPLPEDIPPYPNTSYRDSGWISMEDWLGYKTDYLTYDEAKKFVHSLNLKTSKDWNLFDITKLVILKKTNSSIPKRADTYYKNKGWISWGDFLGTGTIASFNKKFLPYKEARKFVHSLMLKTPKEWKLYCKGELSNLPPKPDNIPIYPYQTYKKSGWIGMGDWLGNEDISDEKIDFIKYDEAKTFVHKLKLNSQTEWVKYCKGEYIHMISKPKNIPNTPSRVYRKKGWVSWGDWLGTNNIASFNRIYRTYEKAQSFVHTLNLKSEKEWRLYCKGEYPNLPTKPDDIPNNPNQTYKDKGWNGIGDWLGTGRIANYDINYLEYSEAIKFVKKLNLKSQKEWKKYCNREYNNLPIKPDNIPNTPDGVYKNKGWTSWGNWLGTKRMANYYIEYKIYDEAIKFVHTLNLKSEKEWKLYCKGEYPNLPTKPDDIPKYPNQTYKDKGWTGLGDWLGTGRIASYKINYLEYSEAIKFVKKLNLKSYKEWRKYCKRENSNLPIKPDNIPNSPDAVYKNKGWTSWGDWLGTDTVASNLIKYKEYNEAIKFVHTLNLKSEKEWKMYCKGELKDLPSKPDDIPKTPHSTYKNKGWKGIGDWLGTGRVSYSNMEYLSFEEAKIFVHTLNLNTKTEWKKYIRGELKDLPILPDNIPKSPNYKYKENGWTSWGDWLGK